LRRHWRLVFGLTLLTGIVAVYALLFAMLAMMMSVPTQRINAEISEASGGRVLTALYVPALFSQGGKARFIFTVAPDVTASDAQTLVCTVVKPTLAREGYQSAAFELDNARNVPLATDTTPCP
jgi:hypothetical protein